MRNKAKGWALNLSWLLNFSFSVLSRFRFLYAEIIPGVRRTLLPRFPYGVFYTVKNDLVHVLAVIHNARNPRRWPLERARLLVIRLDALRR